MLNQVIKAILGVIIRVLLLLAGLVVFASLLAAALLMLGVWLSRALWARLTGQPVRPWAFQVNRQAMWNRFYRPPGNRHPPARDASHVIDVESREVKSVRD